MLLSVSIISFAITSVVASRSAAYFVNWGIYARNFTPADLPSDELSHVMYAFANVRADGTVYLSDPYSDVEIRFSTQTRDGSEKNVYGCVDQLFSLKRRNRNLKVLLSIGGYTYSSNFAAVAASATSRLTFAQSAVQLIEDLGFDGIDVDWEYPSSDVEGQNFVHLLQGCRTALDVAASQRCTPTKFYLSIATSAGAAQYDNIDIQNTDHLIDIWNLMTYDFVVATNDVSAYTANLYPSHDCPTCTPFNAAEVVNAYISRGATPSKILLGIPLYGRAFQHAFPGQPFQGVGDGSWEPGVWDYKALPREGSMVYQDLSAVASFSYDNTTNTTIVYDNEDIVRTKVDYILTNGLGGAFWWESSADKQGEGSLIKVFKSRVGSLEQAENCLTYPFSKYDNIKNL